MNRIGNSVSAVAGLLLLAGNALATGPTPNSAVVIERVFNDCPSSTLVTTNSYPSSIVIDDSNLSCGGFANLHVWRYSEDGTTPILFPNSSSFRIAFDMVISGTAEGEGGVQLTPWWSQLVDGRVNCRTTDGEIACFGGRLPFYSFTGNHGLHYVKGTSIHLEVTYLSNGLSSSDPATVEYKVVYGGTFSSGPLPFDEGNPSEDPPHGLWGMLNEAQAGGYVQEFLQAGNPAAALVTEYSNIVFEQLKPVSVESTSWGKLKAANR